MLGRCGLLEAAHKGGGGTRAELGERPRAEGRGSSGGGGNRACTTTPRSGRQPAPRCCSPPCAEARTPQNAPRLPLYTPAAAPQSPRGRSGPHRPRGNAAHTPTCSCCPQHPTLLLLVLLQLLLPHSPGVGRQQREQLAHRCYCSAGWSSQIRQLGTAASAAAGAAGCRSSEVPAVRAPLADEAPARQGKG